MVSEEDEGEREMGEEEMGGGGETNEEVSGDPATEDMRWWVTTWPSCRRLDMLR